MAVATAMRGLIGAVSGATIVRQTVTYPATEDSPAAPLSSADAVLCGVFIFSCASAGQYAIVEVPGIRADLLQSSGAGAGILVDSSAPAIAALVAELTSGRWCNHWGHIITALDTAFLQIRP